MDKGNLSYSTTEANNLALGERGSLFADSTSAVTGQKIVAIQFLKDTTFSVLSPFDPAYIGSIVVPEDLMAADAVINFTDVNGALTFDTDHYVYTVTTGASVASFTDEGGLIVGNKYKATVLAKDGTGAGSSVRINALTNADAVIQNGTTITVAAAYATASVEWTATEANNKVQVEIIAASVIDGATVLFDDLLINPDAGDHIDASNIFPTGMVIFGQWTGFTPASGECIAYKGSF